MARNVTQELADEAATLQAGRKIASCLQPGCVVFMHGDLGAGKTTMVRGMLQGLGFQGKVKSPTYTLVEPYVFSRFTLYHFDLYRFKDEDEWEAAGFRDYFNHASVCVVEWPEKAPHMLPKPDFEIKITHTVAGVGRKLQVSACTAAAASCLNNQGMLMLSE